MLSRLRPHLSYANVMATIAVFVALGGSAWAASGAASVTMSGSVASDGNVIGQGDLTRVTHGTAGIYNVTFPRSLTNCEVVTTVRGAAPGYSTATTRPKSPRAIVSTFDQAGTLQDRAFYVVANC